MLLLPCLDSCTDKLVIQQATFFNVRRQDFLLFFRRRSLYLKDLSIIKIYTYERILSTHFSWNYRTNHNDSPPTIP